MDAEALLSLDLAAIRLPQGDEESERTVQHFLEILEEHRRLCVAQGKYAEAEISRIRLEELRRYEEHRRREAMVTYQLAERIAVEEANARELQRFNTAWDRAMSEYDVKTQELLEQMKLRHAHEFQEYQDELRLRYPLRPKFSRDLLNTRRIQQVLAKQNQYAEAHRVKTKADLVEEWEMGQQNKLWLDKLGKLERQFVAKQDTELAALIKRIQSGRVGQMRARQSEYERLLQHYQNIKRELLNQQNVERLKAEKQSAQVSSRPGGGSGPASLQYAVPIEVVPQSPVAARSQRVNALLEASAFHSNVAAGQSPIATAANAAAAAAYASLTRAASQAAAATASSPQAYHQAPPPPQSARGTAAPASSQSASAAASARRPLSAGQFASVASSQPTSPANLSYTPASTGGQSRAFNFASASVSGAPIAYSSPFTTASAVQNPQLPPPSVPSLPGSPTASTQAMFSGSMSGRSNGGVGLAGAVGVSRSVMTKQFVPVSRVTEYGAAAATDRISRTPKSNAR